MKKSVQLFLTMLVAVMCSATVHAAIDPYEALRVTPAEGTVTSLQHFTITFSDLPVTVNEAAVPTLEKGGGGTIEGRITGASDGKTVQIDFDESCTASGDYFLHIPDNTLTVNGTQLVPITLRFNIQGDVDTFHEQITVSPAEGTVERLQNFTISFPQYIGEVAPGSHATLKNVQTGMTYQAEMLPTGYKALVYFPEEITKPGDYTLTIPEGSVVFYTMDFSLRELVFNYTIEGEVDLFYDQITIDPAEGPVASLKQFTISFPQAIDGIASGSKATLTNSTSGASYQGNMSVSGQTVKVHLSNEITEPGNYTLTIPEGSLIVNALDEAVRELNFHYLIKPQDSLSYTINPPEGEVYLLQNFTIAYGTPVEVNEDAVATLVNDETGTAYDCHLIEIGGNAMVYKEDPLSELGNYTLHVPAACISILANGTVNPEMTFHYTIVEKEYYVPDVIDSQPAGELRMYKRTGYVIREVEKDSVAEGEWPYELTTIEQDGSLSIVYGENGKVYIQRPVSWSYYNGWVEGTLSADGKTITVPMGQYIAYTYSLEMAIQVAVFTYDEEQGTYFYNSNITELTYTINDDGSISLNGTDEHNILGTMNRAFGQNFQYLDYEWLQDGDYASVYLPIDETPQTPPADIPLETYYLNTAINDGYEWEPYFTTVNVGIDGEDMWLQGISHYLPEAWIKGHIDGNTVTFPNPQLLGTYELLLYFKAADYDPLTGNTTQKDMVLTIEDENTFYTYDYIFITSDEHSLNYLNYYQGLTLSKYPDPVVTVPAGLKTYEYTFSYKTRTESGALEPQQHTVNVGIDGDHVYIQGMWDYLPESWVEGQLVNGQLVFSLPQFIGTIDNEYDIAYPIYFIAFDQSTGRVKRQVTLDYNPASHTFSNQSTAIGLSINKTGYLNLLDIYEAELTPVEDFPAGDVDNDGKTSISDVTALINYLLSHNATGINLLAADVDRDGHCTISDVTALINYLLSH